MDENKNNSNSKKISGISEEESKNFSFYLISGVKDENSAIEKKTEKELIFRIINILLIFNIKFVLK